MLEQNEWIVSPDSSPPVAAAAVTYTPAPTDLVVRRTALSTSVTVEFTPASTVGGRVGGAQPSDIFYNIVAINLKTNNITDIIKHSISVPWSSSKITNNITDLTEGDAYCISVVPYIKYSDTNLNGTTKWSDFQIRKHYAFQNYVAAAPASVPRNFVSKPLNKSFLVSWDSSISLNGGKLETYEFYCAKNVLGNPVGTPAPPNFATDQKAVASAKTPENVIITAAFKNILLGTIGLPTDLEGIVNDTAEYVMSMSTVTAVGDISLTTNSYNYSLSNANPLSILYGSSIAKTLISGIAATPLTGNFAYDSLDKPVNLTSISDATSITLVFDKDSAAEELLISANGEGVFDSTAFSATDTTDVDTSTVGKQITYKGTNHTLTYASGLFQLQQGTIKDAISDIFWVENKNGTVVFNVKITVTSGGSQNLEVRYGKRVGAKVVYSDAATTTASAATPPTPPENPTFDVNTSLMNVSWAAPSDKGGAGTVAFLGASRNSDLLYRVALYSKAGYDATPKVALQTVDNLTSTTYSFSNLSNYNGSNPNGTSYVVSLQAYYNQGGDVKKPSESNVIIINKLNSGSIVPIRVDASPILPSLTFENDIALGNKTTLKYRFQTSPNYPIQKLEIYANNVLVPSLTYTAANPAAAASAIGTILNINVTKTEVPSLLNGNAVVFKAVATPYYLYAQNVVDISATVTTRRAIKGSDITIVPVGSDLKTFTVSVVTGGTKLTNCVAIGKNENNTGALQVINMPTISSVFSGIATATDTNNLTEVFSINFGSSVQEILLILQGEDGIEMKTYPSSSTTWSF